MRAALRFAATLLVVLPVFVLFSIPALAAPIVNGDVLVSDGSSGHVLEFTPSGTLVRSVATDQPDFTGSAFDGSGNFYVTSFTGESVVKFDPSGNRVGTFGSGYGANPESIVFNSAGDAYVGQAGGNRAVLEFDPAGKLLNTYAPTLESKGTDWIELSSDQCTLLYTSEGTSVKSFNVCANHQNPDVATGLPGGAAYELRIRPNGEILVADSTMVVRISATGSVLQKYLVPTTSGNLFALNLDPDGTSVWTADLATGGKVAQIDISSGNVLHEWSAGSTVMPAGLAVGGEIVVGGGGCAVVVACVGGSGSAALAAAGVALVTVVGAAGFTAMKGSPGSAGGLAPAHAVAHHAAMVAGAAAPGAAGATPVSAHPVGAGPPGHPPVQAGAPPGHAELVPSGAEGSGARLSEEAGAKLLEVGEAGLEVGSEGAAVAPALAPLPPEPAPPPVVSPPPVTPAEGSAPSEGGLPGGSRVARDKDEDEETDKS
jgi:outer membrane protein assembly factor BamB